MLDQWITDRLPESKTCVILCLEFPNPDYNKVTVGYYSPDDKEYRSGCFRDVLDNSFYYDDFYEPRAVSKEHVIGWMPFPAHIKSVSKFYGGKK